MGTFSRETLDPWYVTGFAEGEGSFTYSRAGNSLAIYFALRLAETDRAVLTQIQAFFKGVGRIYRQKGTLSPRSGRSRAASYYRVTRTRDLSVIVDHFDRYPLQGEKALSFGIWREMVELKTRELRRGTSPGLLELAAKLSASCRRNRPENP